MSDQDDWDFSGPDDAKAEIRAAVAYMLRAPPEATAVISCRRFFDRAPGRKRVAARAAEFFG